MEHTDLIVDVTTEKSDIQKVVETKNVALNKNEETDNEISSFPLLHSSDLSKKNIQNLSKSNETLVDDVMEHTDLVVDVTTEKSEVQKVVEPAEVVLNKNEETDIEMLPSMLECRSALLPIIGEYTESVLTPDKNLSKSTEICITGAEITDATSIDEKTLKKLPVQTAVTSLSVIASAYDNSDSDSEEVNCIYEEKNNRLHSIEMEVQITKEYRNKVAVETSDEESDSDDSSSNCKSSSSSDDESDESDVSDGTCKRTNNSKKKNERNHKYKGSQEKESKGEFDNLPPIEELKISVPEVLCDPLGEVGWMVEQMVVVRPKPGKPTLNLDTILFVERGRRVLGRIFDVFGQVSEPHYCVRFNSTEHITESDIKVGMTVYFCPNTEYTSVVFLQDLLKMKVSDDLGDDEHPEFSDDEEERAYFAALKQKQKNEKPKCGGEVPQKRQRTTGQDPGWKSNHPWSSGRKQQQPAKKYNTPDWSGSTQQNACHPTNLWHYPSAYPNNPWPPAPESYQGNSWTPVCPQNAYGYSEQFGERHPRGNARPFFRPPHSFQSGPSLYTQSGPYAQQSNPGRYPGTNFPWRSQCPRQPAMAWPLPPPPPPPPPGM